jgi:hypothetical protein
MRVANGAEVRAFDLTGADLEARRPDKGAGAGVWINGCSSDVDDETLESPG